MLFSDLEEFHELYAIECTERYLRRIIITSACISLRQLQKYHIFFVTNIISYDLIE